MLDMFDHLLAGKPFELSNEVLDFLTKQAGKSKRLNWMVGDDVPSSVRVLFDSMPFNKVVDILAPHSIYIMTDHRDGDGIDTVEMLCSNFKWLAENCRYYWFYFQGSIRFACQRDASLFVMWRM